MVKNKMRKAKPLPGQILESLHVIKKVKVLRFCEWIYLPSSPPKRHLLRVPHVRVDLTVFEEPVRIESVRIGIHRFITENRPYSIFNRLQKMKSQNGIAYHTLAMTTVPAGMDSPL